MELGKGWKATYQAPFFPSDATQDKKKTGVLDNLDNLSQSDPVRGYLTELIKPYLPLSRNEGIHEPWSVFKDKPLPPKCVTRRIDTPVARIH